MTFITVELAKFDKSLPEIETNLDKLIFTMKTLQDATEPTQYPQFWDEEWLKRAIEELDTRRMTPEERYQFARITAKNAEVVNAEKGRVADAVKKLSKLNALTAEQIAESLDVSLEFVLHVQNQPEE